MKTVYFAGGCFWCIEYFFRMQKGVISVTSGYSGGKEDNPTYEQVKAQLTGHRETIKIIFDESIISLEDLIDTYFDHIDPTDEKGQFGDIGHSYTLAMYYQNDVEKEIFNQKIDELKKKLNSEVYIKVEPFLSFYIAEERHQNFACKNPTLFMKELKQSGRKKMTDYKLINAELVSISENVKNPITILSNASALLFQSLADINWAGFYLLENNELILGPFQGKVACTKIQIGKGVVGTAVKENKSQVVDDVSKITNHIACDANSKSEIVIPLYQNKKIIGVLDIDSPIISRFSSIDKKGLEEFASLLSSLLPLF